jgi:YVTN family beta-propeller protein
VNRFVNTFDGQYALCVGFRGSLISYATETVVKELNNFVSTSIGAASPVEHRAVMIAQTFGEDMLILDTNGASGVLLDARMSGPDPEGDKTRMVAISADGTRAVATGILSDSAGVFDLANQTLLGIPSVGDRPAGVELTPDGSRAVVANLDSTFTTIIDMNTLLPTNVTISRRAGEVEMAPDGSVAYLAVVADGDGVWRVNPNTQTVIGAKLATGDMGAVGFMYQQVSGLTLSHDGATLVTCNSFHNTQAGQPDSISIIDTASWTELKRLIVGQFPVRAVFSPDDSKIYVSNRDDDSISVVENLGAGSIVSSTIPVGDQPFEMAVAPDGTRLYVMDFNSKRISFVNLPGGAISNTVALPNFPAGMHLTPAGDTLYVATGNWSVTLGPGPLTVISEDGELSVIDTATASIAGTHEIGHPPAALRFNDASGRGAAPSPFIDGLALFEFGGAPCPGDFDDDGDVDQSDLGVLLADFGCTDGIGNCEGDIDGDGDTDQSDLGVLLAAFGQPCR